MAKFEINNPEALKFIEDVKSGAYFRPFLEKLRRLKWVFITVGVVITLLIFFSIGRSLSRGIDQKGYTPPVFDIDRTVTEKPVESEFSSLKEEIFLFSTEMPDPVLPDLSNTIDLKPEVF